jgi:hypothetical protein
MAKINLVKELESGNVEISKWWLERKAKEEFALKATSLNNVNNLMEVKLTKEETKFIEDKIRMNG